jgi:hypothetical protein
MEYIFEWHLVYRNAAQFETLRPDEAPPGSYVVKSEKSASNIFIEIRKPARA